MRVPTGRGDENASTDPQDYRFLDDPGGFTFVIALTKTKRYVTILQPFPSGNGASELEGEPLSSPQVVSTTPSHPGIFPDCGRTRRRPKPQILEIDAFTPRHLPRKTRTKPAKNACEPAAVVPRGHRAAFLSVVKDPTVTRTTRLIAATLLEMSDLCGSKRLRLQRDLRNALTATQRDESENALSALRICEKIYADIGSGSIVKALKRALHACIANDANKAQWNSLKEAVNGINPNSPNLQSLLDAPHGESRGPKVPGASDQPPAPADPSIYDDLLFSN